MEFRHIRADDLYEFSEEFIHSKAQDLAITPWRVKSQCANPYVQSDDVLLVVAINSEGVIKGYIGILPTQCSQNIQSRIYWNTCWWVADDAGAGVSMSLFSHFLRLTKSRIVFSDLSEHTEKIISRLGAFQTFKRRGVLLRVRSAYHLRVKNIRHPNFIHKLLAGSGVLCVIDRLMNIGVDRKLSSHPYLEHRTGEMQTHDSLLSEHQTFIEEKGKLGLIKPDRDLYEWWKAYPWLTSSSKYSKDIASRYYFSVRASSFNYQVLDVRNRGVLLGVAICKFRNGTMTTDFLYYEEEHEEMFFRSLIRYFLLNKNLHTIVSYHEACLKYLDRSGIHDKCKKELHRYFGYAKVLREEMAEEPIFQDGDGDVIFT